LHRAAQAFTQAGLDHAIPGIGARTTFRSASPPRTSRTAAYIFANRAFERFSRFSRDHIVGKRADEIFRFETAGAIEARIRRR